MSRGAASVATIEHLMGHDSGPTPARLRGASDGPATLIGVVPAVHSSQSESLAMNRVSDLFGRICMMVTFVLWVVLPVLGILRIIVGS